MPSTTQSQIVTVLAKHDSHLRRYQLYGYGV